MKQCKNCNFSYTDDESACPRCKSSDYNLIIDKFPSIHRAFLLTMFMLIGFFAFSQHYVGNFTDEQLLVYRPINQVVIVQKYENHRVSFTSVNKIHNWIFFKSTAEYTKVVNSDKCYDVYRVIHYYQPFHIRKFTKRNYDKTFYPEKVLRRNAKRSTQ